MNKNPLEKPTVSKLDISSLRIKSAFMADFMYTFQRDSSFKKHCLIAILPLSFYEKATGHDIEYGMPCVLKKACLRYHLIHGC